MPNMKTIGFFVATVVINRQNCHFFIEKSAPGGHLEFPNFTKFLPRHLLTYTNPYSKFKKNLLHLQLVERER